MRQLPLPLAPEPSFAAADFIEDESSAEARAWLARPAGWPLGRLALVGPEGSGKTHLLRATAAARGWAVLEGPALRGLPARPAAGVALDDADAAAEEAALFHLLNACAEAGVPLLLAGRAPPSRWAVRLPDLRSRLAATPFAALHPPGDALLAALLAKHLADRQLVLDPGLQAFVLARLPRKAAAMGEAAARLDRAALAAGRRLTRAAALAALGDLMRDGSETSAETTLPPAPALL
jgi:chromosomal replication initiation ATPase DnaA